MGRHFDIVSFIFFPPLIILLPSNFNIHWLINNNYYSGVSQIMIFCWFIYLFISAWTYRDLFYSMDAHSLLSLFVAQIVLDLAIGSTFRLTLVPFWHAPIVFISLCSDTICSKITLYLPCPTHGISHFSKKPWILLLALAILISTGLSLFIDFCGWD